MTQLAAALSHAKRGFPVFPIKPGAKFPPLLQDWPNKATRDPVEIDILWAPMPDANIGIHCAGLVVVDIDTRSGGDVSLQTLGDVYDIPATLTARTPSGGRHLFFRLPDGHPGVGNSAGKLGPGLDIKTAGGYVVAAGSDVPTGRYVWENPSADIATAPEWLLRLLGPKAAKVATAPAAAIPDAPDALLERAREWLAQQPVGGGHSYANACGLRDRGLSLLQAQQVFSERDPRPDAVDQVAHAYRYAQGEPGAKAALPTDFPVIPETAPAKPVRPPAKAMRLSELTAGATRGPGYLVKGLLDRKSYAMEYGQPGAGKTFVALDIAYHVAAGKPWMERKVHQGPVLYLAFEGRGGIVKRGKALRQKYGEADVPLYVASAGFNLREQAGRQELGRLIAELPAKPVLIVVDTFAHALMGGDENSAQDVGAFNNAIQALIDSTEACVLLIHHPTKAGTTARGSGALPGAVDTVLEIEGGMVKSAKQRESELADPIGFKLVPMVVGVDDDGEAVTSCVVEPGAAAPVMPRTTGNPKRGFAVLCDLSPDNAPVDQDAWRDACRDFLGKGRSSFFDMKRSLAKGGYIIVNGNYVTRRLE